MKLQATTGGRIKTQRALSAKNERRIEKKNKDVTNGRHPKQVGREETKKEINR